MGRAIAPRVAARFGRAILELGGNNAAVVAPSADLDLAVRGIVFAAAGTAGQRCTTLRRLIVHESRRRRRSSSGWPWRTAASTVGDPFDERHAGRSALHADAYQAMQDALAEAEADGGTVVAGGERVGRGPRNAYYVRPALVADRRPRPTSSGGRRSRPILYVLTYRDLTEAVAAAQRRTAGSVVVHLHRGTSREAELFLSAEGSDCGIVNVNIGTSGAEIGGAFGGEKTTGGGRESGSDAWRAYMRRATNTINYSPDLPLAQGVSFV